MLVGNDLGENNSLCFESPADRSARVGDVSVTCGEWDDTSGDYRGLGRPHVGVDEIVCVCDAVENVISSNASSSNYSQKENFDVELGADEKCRKCMLIKNKLKNLEKNDGMDLQNLKEAHTTRETRIKKEFDEYFKNVNFDEIDLKAEKNVKESKPFNDNPSDQQNFCEEYFDDIIKKSVENVTRRLKVNKPEFNNYSNYRHSLIERKIFSNYDDSDSHQKHSSHESKSQRSSRIIPHEFFTPQRDDNTSEFESLRNVNRPHSTIFSAGEDLYKHCSERCKKYMSVVGQITPEKIIRNPSLLGKKFTKPVECSENALSLFEEKVKQKLYVSSSLPEHNTELNKTHDTLVDLHNTEENLIFHPLPTLSAQSVENFSYENPNYK